MRTLQVAASAGDVNELNGTLDSASTTVWLGTGGSTTTSFTGFRFTGVDVPQGATITSAYLQLYSTQSQWITYSFTIAADASGNSAGFTTTARPSQRAQTTNKVTHSDNVNWAANTWYSLDEIKAIVQEVVNRPDWQAGNSLSIILKGTGTGAFARKWVRSFDGAAATAPRLVISFSSAATPPTASLSTSPTTIFAGQSTVLSWNTSGATTVSIDQGVGTVAASGSITVTPAATTTYTLSATNGAGTTTATAGVTVNAPPPMPTVSFGVSPNPITSGSSALLSWSSTDATSVTIDQGIGSVAASGSRSVTPGATTTYTITASNFTGTATSSVTLTVNPPAPTATVSVSPNPITSGSSATLSWSSTNAVSVSIDQGIGTVSASGTRTVSPTATTTYTITATNATGTATNSVTLTVNPLPLPTVTPSVSPNPITSGSSSTLSWTSTNATTLSIDQGIGTVAASGTRTVSPTSTTTYTFTATNSTGTVTNTATLTVNPPAPTASLTVTPASISSGASATLSWTTSGATTVTIDQGIGTVAATGSSTVTPAATTTYTLTATNGTGSTVKTATVSVNAPSGNITAQINASGDDVNENNSALTTNATTLWLGNGGSTTTSYAALRFNGLAIPSGATISTATLQVYSTQSQWIGLTFTIAADAAGNSAAFTTTSRPSQRTLTTAKISHDDNVKWNPSTWYTLDEMKSVIQEIVNRADWQPGNSLSIIIKGGGSGTFARKFINSVEGSAANAPKLVIGYTGAVTPPPAPTTSLSASPTSINSGQFTLLTWGSTNASTVSINQGIGNVAPSGSMSLSPAATTTYTVTATNTTGTATASATVTVAPGPTATISVSPTSITAGGSATLSWSTTNATSASIDQGIGSVPLTGSTSVSPAATTTYTITATGSAGSTSRSATLTVNADTSTAFFPVGPGFTDVVPHQLIRTSSDQVYVFASKQPYTSILSAYGTPGAGLPSTTSDFVLAGSVDLGSVPISVSPAYNGASTVHVLANLQNGSLVDVPFDVSTNTFKTQRTLASGTATVSGDYIGTSGVSTMVDLNGILHVAYWTSSNQIVHAAYSYDTASNTLTQVSAPTRVDTGGSARHPSLAVSPLDNSVTVAWVSLATTPKRILARVRDSAGNWSSVQNVSNTSVDVWTSTAAGLDIDQGPSLVIGGDGAKHLAYIENFDSTGDYGSIHYVMDNGTGWVDRELTSTYTHDPAVAINATGQVYIIGHGHPNDTAAACKSEGDMCIVTKNSDGTWSNPTLFAKAPNGTSFDASPSVKWSAVGFNRPDVVEFLFFQTPYTTPTIYYARLP